MKATRILMIGAAILVFTAGAAVMSMAETESEIELENAPAAVQSAISAHLDGGKVLEVELNKEDGAETYEVEGMKNGEKTEFVVTSDGQILPSKADDEEEGEEEEGREDGKEEVIANVSALPAPVRAAVEKIVGANPIAQLSKETEEGAARYEVEYSVAGIENSATLADDGSILEIENKMDPEALPAAALAALKKDYPGATFKEADAVQAFYYEVEVVRDGKTFEVKVLATGDIEDGHEGEGHSCGKMKHDEDEEHEGFHGKAEKKSHENEEEDED